MFETLNAILGMDVIRYSLLMGSGALLAYTLRPLPSAIDTFASYNSLKFGTLFLFGLLMAYPLNLTKFMVVFLAALIIMVLFEYFRQVDKGLLATKGSAKEYMADPYFGQPRTYPGQVPYGDPRLGIPQYLPDGKTLDVVYNGYNGMSNTGNYVEPKLNKEMFGGDDAYYQGMPQSYSAGAPYGDPMWGIPSKLADGSPGLVYDSHAYENLENPLAPMWADARNLSQLGMNAASRFGIDIASAVRG